MKVRIADVRLLSKAEYLQDIDLVGKRQPWWWLGDTCPDKNGYALAVYLTDVIGLYEVEQTFGVVPVLVLQDKTLPAGSKLSYGGEIFTVLRDGLAICDKRIAHCAFRKDWQAEDANDYAKSDIKQQLEKWFSTNGNTSELIQL